MNDNKDNITFKVNISEADTILALIKTRVSDLKKQALYHYKNNDDTAGDSCKDTADILDALFIKLIQQRNLSRVLGEK